MFSGWFLGCVLRSPGAVPSRLAHAQELVPVWPVTLMVGSGLLWRGRSSARFLVFFFFI